MSCFVICGRNNISFNLFTIQPFSTKFLSNVPFNFSLSFSLSLSLSLSLHLILYLLPMKSLSHSFTKTQFRKFLLFSRKKKNNIVNLFWDNVLIKVYKHDGSNSSVYIKSEGIKKECLFSSKVSLQTVFHHRTLIILFCLPGNQIDLFFPSCRLNLLSWVLWLFFLFYCCLDLFKTSKLNF